MFGCVERRIHLRVAASGFVHFAQAFFFQNVYLFCFFLRFARYFCILSANITFLFERVQS